MASQMIQIPSICIPRVYYNYSDEYVARVFDELFGDDETGNSCVERIDMKLRQDKRTGEDFWMVFVHFSPQMARTRELEAFVERLEQGEQVKIQYRHPWFWKVSKNKSVKKPRQGPRILSVEDEEDIKKFQKEQLESKKTKKQPVKVATPPPTPPTTPFEDEEEGEENEEENAGEKVEEEK